MALWTKAQHLEEVHSIYGDHFPIEVRHFLASWIEDKAWTDIDLDNPQHEVYVTNLVASLIQELENRVNIMGGAEEMFLLRRKLLHALENFKHLYSHDPRALFKTIQACLTQEMRIVQQNDPMGSPIRIDSMPVYNQNATDILRDLELLRARTQKTAATLHKMDNAQEAFNLSYHDFTNITTHIEYLKTAEASPKNLELKRQFEQQKLMMDQLLNTKIKALGQDRCQLADNLKETCFLIENTQGKILNVELLKWKREQQLQGNGARYNCTLDMIQGYCESLAEIIWMTRQQIKEAERLKNLISKYVDPPNMVDVLPNLNAQITQCLSHLVTSTFIIEKQPPQVMKTNTRFSATVRLLTGSKLNVYMTPPQVKAQIICESQANALLKNEKIGKSDASGEILNNMGVMEYNTHSKVLSISLRNMQLKKIKRRPEKRGTESVMDEKFSLYFSSTFSIGGGELVFQVWTLSLPVAVIVHGNQEPNAHATITWDNAFAEPGRSPFVVPDKRPWKMIADVLMMKFESATGRTLDAENLNFLAEKAFRQATDIKMAECADYSNMLLNWSQFCKEPLPDRSFTFWDWFYAVMKLTREHLKNVWTDGHIMGFVRKRKAEEMLASQVKGTFLLRFSDSELGGITIAWKGDNTEVFMLQPFTSKDFQIRNLADRISDLPHLVYLYPDKPKDQAFSKYYTPFQDSQPMGTNGYVKPVLVTHVPGWGSPNNNGMGGMNSYPSTPQNMFHPHSPPDHTRDTTSVVSADSNYPNGLEGGPGMEYDIFSSPDLSELPQINEEDVEIQLNQFKYTTSPSEL